MLQAYFCAVRVSMAPRPHDELNAKVAAMGQAFMLCHYQSAGEMPYKSHHKTHKRWDYGQVFLFENVGQPHT